MEEYTHTTLSPVVRKSEEGHKKRGSAFSLDARSAGTDNNGKRNISTPEASSKRKTAMIRREEQKTSGLGRDTMLGEGEHFNHHHRASSPEL